MAAIANISMHHCTFKASGRIASGRIASGRIASGRI